MSHLVTSKTPRGFAGYFWSMLADVDRAKRYRAAIVAAVRDFVQAEGRSPVVLDVGCGTGLLSWLAIEAGAAKVYAADTNPDVLALAKTNLGRSWPKDKFEAVLVTPNQIPAGVPKVDMLVSEILGTLINSEDALKYVGMYMRAKLRTFGEAGHERVYVIPRMATQKLVLRAFYGVPPALRVAVQNAVDDAWKLGHWSPTNENGLSVLLHAFPSTTKAVANFAVRVEYYDVPRPYAESNPKCMMPRDAASLAVDDDPLYLGVFEWEVQLWNDATILNNTPTAMRAVGAQTAVSRDSAWGYIVIPPLWGEVLDVTFQGTGVTVSTSRSGRAATAPEGDFRGEDGTVLAPARFAADFDLVEEVTRGFRAWAEAKLPRGEGTVVVYDDRTSGLLLDTVSRAFAGTAVRVVALGHRDVYHRNAVEAYPDATIFTDTRRQREWLASLPAPVLLLAPRRADLAARAAAAFPYSEYPAYPAPRAKPTTTKHAARLPAEHFFARAPGLRETGVTSLMQRKSPAVPYNLFPSLGYTLATSVAYEDPQDGWDAETDVVALADDDEDHAPVSFEVQETEGIASASVVNLRRLAHRNRAVHGVFVDQLSLVARATSQAKPNKFKTLPTPL